jgi:hypothetical protein
LRRRARLKTLRQAEGQGHCKMRKTKGTKIPNDFRIILLQSKTVLPSRNDQGGWNPQTCGAGNDAIFDMAKQYSDLRNTVLWRSNLDDRK